MLLEAQMNRRDFLGLTAASAVALSLGACGGSAGGSGTGSGADADQVRSALETYLSQLKAASGEAFDLAVAKMKELCADQLADLGATPEDLAREYLQKFDYAIEDVQVTGASALAKVKISARSVTKIIKDTAAKGDPLHFKLQDLLDTMRDAPVQDSEASVYCKKANDGSWDVKDGLSQSLVKLCF